MVLEGTKFINEYTHHPCFTFIFVCVSTSMGFIIVIFRLINYDVDKWIHLNCALWSEEVYETENGALVNVEVALKQSLNVACALCKLNGASVKCFKVRCTSVYHVGCAVKDGCAFYKNKVSKMRRFIKASVRMIAYQTINFVVSYVIVLFYTHKT